jgi:hypothetical protein
MSLSHHRLRYILARKVPVPYQRLFIRCIEKGSSSIVRSQLSSSPPITVSLRSRRPVSSRERWEVHITTVSVLLMWGLVVLQFILQIIGMLLENLPTRLFSALPRLWMSTYGDFWLNPWETKLGQILFLLALYFGAMFYACFQTRKSIDEFTLWIASFHYHSRPQDLLGNRIVRRVSLLLLHTRESFGIAISLPSLRTLDQLYVSVRESEGNLPPGVTPTVVESNAAAISLPLTEDVPADTRIASIQELCHSEAHLRLLNEFVMRVVGPTGITIEIHFLNTHHFELVVYIATRTRSGRWITTQDILRDVYDCDEDASDEEQRRAKNLFHRHLVEIRKHVAERLQGAGLPNEDLFERKRTNHSMWRLSAWCQVDDLTVLDRCRRLLTSLKKQEDVDEALLKAICQEVHVLYTGDFLATHRRLGQVRVWAEVPLRESALTFLEALRYLANEARQAGEAEGQEEAVRHHQQREAQLWSEYALCCARTLYDVPVLDQTTMSKRGEQSLRRCMELHIRIKDPLAAVDVYLMFEKVMLDEDPAWKPEPSTLEVWQRVLRELGE